MLQRGLLKTLMLVFIIVGFLLASPALLKLDFSRSSYLAGDIIQVLPLPAIVYLFSLPTCLSLIYKLEKRLSIIIPFALVMAIFIIFPLLQYPLIFHNDVLWHLSVVKGIVKNGYVASSTGYEIYPGTFILTAIVSYVLGLPILETGLMLGILWVIFITTFLLCIGRLLTKSSNELFKVCWWCPTSFLAYNFMFYNNYHYSPQLFGFLLYIIVSFTIIKLLYSKLLRLSILIILLVLLSAITITHVFSGFFSIATMFCLYIGGTKIKSKSLSSKPITPFVIVLFTVVLFISWHNFVAVQIFEQSIKSLTTIIKGEKSIFGFFEAVTPGFFRLKELETILPFISLYRYGTYIVFALLSISGLTLYWNKVEGRLFFWQSVGILLGSIIIYLTPATFGVPRMIYYAAIVISSLSLLAVVKECRSHIFAIRIIFKIMKVLLPFLVIGAFLIANMTNCTYTQFTHTDELKAMEFIAQKNAKKQTCMLLLHAYIMRFVEEDHISLLAIDDLAPAEIARTTLENGELSFQYLPRLVAYYNMSFVEGRNHLIYSNGLARIYAKTNSK